MRARKRGRRSTVAGRVAVAVGLAAPGLLGVVSDAGAQAAVPSGAGLPPIPEALHPPSIDGYIDAAEWEGALLLDLPFEIRPAANGPAAVATRCRMLKGDGRLLVGCRAVDPRPGSIRAQYTDRDDVLGSDRIILVLDPFDDGQRGFVFAVNAVGVQADGVLDQASGSTDYSWNTIWDSAGRITDGGFDVEFAIPFRSLRYPSRPASARWRFYIEREWPRSEATTLRSTRNDPDDPCALCHAQAVSPGAIPRPGADIEAVPAVTAARTDSRSEAGRGLARGSVDSDAGVDVRWGVSSEASLSLALNPDFSQVEADEPQLAANARFALRVPERRPFFLEGAELLRTPLNALFTRAIADPVAGAKLIGRAGAWSGGVLYARDETTRLLIPGSAGSDAAGLDTGSHAWAGRSTRTWSDRFAAGALMTHRTAEGYANTVGGFDAYARPLRALEVRVQALEASTLYPATIADAYAQPASRFNGRALHGVARYATRNWRAHALLETIDPEFRADLGFMPQVDSRREEASLTRRVWGDDISWMTRFEGSVGYWSLRSSENVLKERGVWSQASIYGPLQTSLSVNPFWLTERFGELDYERSGINLSVSAQPTADFGGEVHASRASVVDYANRRLARLREVQASADVRLWRRLSMDVTAGRREIRHDGLLVAGETIVLARPVIGLTSRAFLSLLAQARRLERDAEAYAGPVRGRETTVESQVLFTYRLDGQTALRVGYSDLSSDEGPGLDALPLERQSRTLFLKLSWAWRP